MCEREEIEVMDTPDRCKNNQIANSTRKFEDSPVYSFLNQLSPLKPVKSSQTINHLAFVSLPSVFTSPHVTSLRDCRSLQRLQLPDPSKPEFSSDNVDEADKSRSNVEVTRTLDEQKENRNPRLCTGKMANPLSKGVTELAENLSYDCKSPISNLRPTCAFIDESSKRKENLRGVSQIDPNKDSPSCDWESLISDVFTFESPNDTDSYKKAIDHGQRFYNSIENEVPNTNGHLVSNDGSDVENLSTQSIEGSEMIGNEEIHEISNPSEKMNLEEIGFYRGMRRRCLVFEMAEARRKQLDQNSGSDSSTLLQSNEQLLVAVGNEASRCVLPGIGLHLNTLATTPKNYKIVSYESAAYGRFLVGPTSSSVNIPPSTTSQEPLNESLALVSSEKDSGETENCVFPMEEAFGVNEYIANEDFNQSSSPKRKRRRPELAVEGESSCKRCNCKKSKCLKLYCECFAAGVYCVEPCACIDCFNKPIHEETVLATRKQIESRNPLAFAPKVIRKSDPVIETGDDSSKTPASARHKRGCNCKKSGCLKKYCECYQGGVGCSINCRCEGCKNAFGRKEGSCMMAMEVEIEEDDVEMTEKSVVDKSLKKPVIQNELQQNMDSASLATPLRAVRQSASKNKPPRSSFPSIGSSSSSFLANQVYDKPSFFHSPQKFENRFETVWEDEIPEFLQGDSPISGVKSLSPNQKRVSSPHAAGMSSGLLRSSRKLVLQSISSFPSLGSTQ